MEAHTMNKSITQATKNDKQLSKLIKSFHVFSALKITNAYKKKRISDREIF